MNKITEKPVWTDEYKDYYKNVQQLDSIKLMVIEAKIQNKEKFNKLLQGAITQAKEKGGSRDEFEEYVAKYDSKETLSRYKENESRCT